MADYRFWQLTTLDNLYLRIFADHYMIDVLNHRIFDLNHIDRLDPTDLRNWQQLANLSINKFSAYDPLIMTIDTTIHVGYYDGRQVHWGLELPANITDYDFFPNNLIAYVQQNQIVVHQFNNNEFRHLATSSFATSDEQIINYEVRLQDNTWLRLFVHYGAGTYDSATAYQVINLINDERQTYQDEITIVNSDDMTEAHNIFVVEIFYSIELSYDGRYLLADGLSDGQDLFFYLDLMTFRYHSYGYDQNWIVSQNIGWTKDNQLKMYHMNQKRSRTEYYFLLDVATGRQSHLIVATQKQKKLRYYQSSNSNYDHYILAYRGHQLLLVDFIHDQIKILKLPDNYNLSSLLNFQNFIYNQNEISLVFDKFQLALADSYRDAESRELVQWYLTALSWYTGGNISLLPPEMLDKLLTTIRPPPKNI